MGNLSTGTFGALSFVSSAGGTGLGSGADTSSDFKVTYVFAVSGASNGTSQFDVASSGVLASNIGTASAEFEYVGESATINGVPGPVGGAPLSTGTTNIVITTPITNGTSTLQFELALGADCAGIDPCTSSADFLDPTQITGATVFDTNGHRVTGATLISQSGFNPNVSVTPEPASMVLFGTGLLGIVFVVRKRLFA